MPRGRPRKHPIGAIQKPKKKPGPKRAPRKPQEDFVWKKVLGLRVDPETSTPDDPQVQVFVKWTSKFDDSWLAITDFPVAEPVFLDLMSAKWKQAPEFFTEPVKAVFRKQGLLVNDDGSVVVSEELERKRQAELAVLDALAEEKQKRSEERRLKRAAKAAAKAAKLDPKKTRSLRGTRNSEETYRPETPSPVPQEPTPSEPAETPVLALEPQTVPTPAPTPVSPVENPYAQVRPAQVQVQPQPVPPLVQPQTYQAQYQVPAQAQAQYPAQTYQAQYPQQYYQTAPAQYHGYSAAAPAQMTYSPYYGGAMAYPQQQWGYANQYYAPQPQYQAYAPPPCAYENVSEIQFEPPIFF